MKPSRKRKLTKVNLPERLGNLINKAEKFDTEVSKKLQEDLITPHIRKKGTYQKGSFDEQLIEMFYKKEQERKGKLKEKEKPATSKEELKEEINEDE